MRLAILFLLGTLAAHALPNAVLGPIAEADSPLNDQDLTDQVLAGKLWSGDRELPGTWRVDAPVAGLRSSHLLARPKAFGLPVVFLQANHREDILYSLTLTFADAGSYFGYFAGPARGEDRRAAEQRLRQRQADFAALYEDTKITLRKALAKQSSSRPRENSLGKTRTLRATVTDYSLESGLVLRLIEGEGRLLRVLIQRETDLQRTWLDPVQAERERSERLAGFAEALSRTAEGDCLIPELPVVPQGYRPYCGLNTLTMAARYFGLHVDEDWLAVAGQFQNTGSAAGSRMPRLYQAVAKEAELEMVRLNGFDLIEARRSLQEGLPVVVWRRFSQERDRAHTVHARRHARDPSLTLPAPSQEERERYPGEDAPLHASILVGYNDTNRELLFLESWSGKDTPRRMRAEELDATAYLTFCFRP